MNDWGVTIEDFRKAVSRWSSVPSPVTAGETVTWTCGYPTGSGPCPFSVDEEITEDGWVDLGRGMPEEMLHHLWWELHYFEVDPPRLRVRLHPMTIFALGIVTGSIVNVVFTYLLS